MILILRHRENWVGNKLLPNDTLFVSALMHATSVCFSQTIGQVTPKISYFYNRKCHFSDKSILQISFLILKTRSLHAMRLVVFLFMCVPTIFTMYVRLMSRVWVCPYASAISRLRGPRCFSHTARSFWTSIWSLPPGKNSAITTRPFVMLRIRIVRLPALQNPN